MRKYLLLFAIFFVFTLSAYAQSKVSMIGVKTAFNISSVDFKPTEVSGSIQTSKNISLSYIYFHDLWNQMPYFGFQAELYYQEQGYMLNNQKHLIKCVEIPLTSKFHIDFWKMRFLINAGGFVGYRMSSSVGYTSEDFRYDYGFTGGLGLAYIAKPFEIHVEGNYQYSLAYMYGPQRYSETILHFTHPKQLLLSVALYIHLNK